MDDDLRKEIKARIINARQIAKESGVDYPYLTLFLNGKKEIGEKVRDKLKRWLEG